MTRRSARRLSPSSLVLYACACAGADASPASPVRCAWYRIDSLKWFPNRRVGGRAWPLLGALSRAPAGSVNTSLCDGYGAASTGVPCRTCPGDAYAENGGQWNAFQCARVPLVPAEAAWAAKARGVKVLMVGSDHNNHGLFAQVERALNQLYVAETLGLMPFVYLGEMVWASPDSCSNGKNQYYDATAGDNVWEYYFEPVSPYQLGAPTVDRRAVRLLLIGEAQARRFAIDHAGDAVTSYFDFNRFDAPDLELRQRVRSLGAKLLRRWVRIKHPLRREAAALLRRWRGGGGGLLGVHLRGTDKAAHPKVPLSRFTKLADRYLAAFPNASIVLCTDDASYHARFVERYGGRVRSRTAGYAVENVVRDPTLARARKGADAVIDALLLAHTDYLLKSTSALAEFAIWHSPRLADAHLDLQIPEGVAKGEAYQSRVPKWAGGAYDPPTLTAAEAELALRALEATPQATRPPLRLSPFRRGSNGAARGSTETMSTMYSAELSARASSMGSQHNGSPPWAPEWPTQWTPPSIDITAPTAAYAAPASGSAVKPPPYAIRVVSGSDGCVRTPSLSPLTREECREYARRASLEHIGSTSNRNEPTGCLLWEERHVEFNELGRVGGGCRLGRIGRCVCKVV